MAGAILWAALAGLLAVGAATCVVLLRLIRTQGEMHLDLDALEMGLRDASAPSDAGVAVGTEVDPMPLPDLRGELISLRELRGREVLLVHWSAECGFCDLIAGELAELAPRLRAAGIELVLASYGTAEEHSALVYEHGLDAAVLLQERLELDCFEGLGTPVAYRLDASGRIAEPAAVGADEVPALARRLAAERAAALPGR